MKIHFNKMHKDAVTPTQKVKTDACWDLYTCEEVKKISPHQIIQLKTGIRTIIPDGYEGVVRQRSGMSLEWNNYISNSPGTIDAQYREEILIAFVNNTGSVIEKIKKGTKIAQIGFRKVPEFEMVEIDDSLYEKYKESSDREGGFGSSGNKI